AKTLDFKQMEQWGLNDYAQFFEESHKKFGQKDSELYQNVKTQFNAFRQLQSTPITNDSVAEILSAGQKLADACSAYIKAIGDRRVYTGTGQKRVEVIKNLDSFFHKQLVRLREPLIFNANAGKTLNQLNIEPAAHIQDASFENQVGGNASERYQVTYQDKRGFFTPKEYVRDPLVFTDEMVKAEKNPEHQKVLEANKDTLIMTADLFQLASARGIESEERNVHDMMKYWVSLPEHTKEEVEKKKTLAGLITNGGKFAQMRTLIDNYRTKLNTLSEEDRKDPAKRENAFRACLDTYRTTQEYDTLSKCGEMIARYADTREPIRGGLKGIEAGKSSFERVLMGSMMQEFASGGFRSYQNMKTLLENPDIYEKSITILKKASMAALPMGHQYGELKAGNELSGRNVASSRMAELLGVGNLLAHSEKMTVQIDGQKVEGCFMEFAEGVDICNGKDAAMEQINQIRMENSPGFTRDACNLEVLDYLCAQADRHGGNMFLKLSEPQADGTREILGVQGIDNDLAFSTLTENLPMKQGQLQDLCFLSENLAKNILAMDRNRLQFVFGDILSENEINALDIRMTQMKDHIRNHMIQVKDDEWALDRDPSRKLEQALAADPAKLSRYQQGVNSLNEGLDPDPTQSFWTHKNSYVVLEIRKAQERYNSLQAEREPVQPEREQEQPERTENPAANRQVVKESLNMWLKEEARSKGGPKAEMPQKSREIELGAHRRGPHK
ncbi:MAG: hypothetical protein PUB88_10670, partial [Clostridium sp.]|nr:hypothetical protein [Clostridium sp.]